MIVKTILTLGHTHSIHAFHAQCSFLLLLFACKKKNVY